MMSDKNVSSEPDPIPGYSYETPWKSPVFEHARSFWLASYGTDVKSRPDGKIVVFGFPKSGNSWAVSLLGDYYDIAIIDPVADVGAAGVGMTHLPFCPYIADRPDFLRGVCMVRDPRDVVVSYFHYTQTAAFRRARPEFHYDDLRSFYYDWFLGRGAPAHCFSRHAERYARMGVPILRYEALRADPARTFSRLLLTWGDAPDPARVEASIETNDISNLRREGKMLNTFTESSHFREGAVGGFESELPVDIVSDIEIRFGIAIGRWGYGFTTSEGRRVFQDSLSNRTDFPSGEDDFHKPSVNVSDSKQPSKNRTL